MAKAERMILTVSTRDVKIRRIHRLSQIFEILHITRR